MGSLHPVLLNLLCLKKIKNHKLALIWKYLQCYCIECNCRHICVHWICYQICLLLCLRQFVSFFSIMIKRSKRHFYFLRENIFKMNLYKYDRWVLLSTSVEIWSNCQFYCCYHERYVFRRGRGERGVGGGGERSDQFTPRGGCISCYLLIFNYSISRKMLASIN